jgi:hypothetical protein
MFSQIKSDEIPEFHGYCDVSEKCQEDFQSTTGLLFKLNTGTISWSSNKQSTTYILAAEEKYIALSYPVQQAVWVRTVSKDLGFTQVNAIFRKETRALIESVKHYRHLIVKPMIFWTDHEALEGWNHDGASKRILYGGPVKP